MNILYTTTVGSTMGFFKTFIKELISDGNKVDIATNECNGESIVQPCFREWGCKVYHIDTSRSPFSLGNFRAIKQIREIVKKGGYDIVHCHTPLVAAATRLACKGLRKKGLKVIYTAHGFHFYKGAPLKNWLIYYPIEKICARYTDVLITINKEDFALAQKKMPAKKVCYVPGVGIDLERIRSVQVDRNEIRRSMGVPEDCTLLLSVGELNVNKNHQVVLKALAKLNNKCVHYAIAGIGDQKENLLNLAKELSIEKQFHLLGYRTDALKLYRSADVFVFPSFREGLSVSMMEAMASGLSIVCSKIRGNVDLVQNGIGGYNFMPTNVENLARQIDLLIENVAERKKMGLANKETINTFSLNCILKKMDEIYKELIP